MCCECPAILLVSKYKAYDLYGKLTLEGDMKNAKKKEASALRRTDL